MGNNESQNLFDAFSDNLRKKQKKKKIKEGTKSQKNVPPKNMPAISNEEIDIIFKKLRNMDEDLQKRMDYIAELSGMTPKQVEEFIANPNNFSDKDWLRMQEKKQALEKQIYSSIGIKYQRGILNKKKKKIQKGRRGKTLGVRKGWIQM